MHRRDWWPTAGALQGDGGPGHGARTREKEIEISINGRESEYFVSADSKIFSVSIDSKLYVSKAPYVLKMVEFEEDSYINTLREKLMWGKDRRTEQ